MGRIKDVIYAGDGAYDLARDNERVIEILKKKFTEFFGKDRENSICSCLDFPVYIYYETSDDLDKVKKNMPVADLISIFAERGCKPFDLKHYLNDYLKRAYTGEGSVKNAGRVASLMNFFDVDNYVDTQIAFLPPKADGITITHELLHAISTSRVYQKNGDVMEQKAGLRTTNYLELEDKNILLNEVFTEYLANKIYGELKDDGKTFGANYQFHSAYESFFPFFGEMFEKYLDEFKEAYIGRNLKPLYDIFDEKDLAEVSLNLDRFDDGCPPKEIFGRYQEVKYIKDANERLQTFVFNSIKDYEKKFNKVKNEDELIKLRYTLTLIYKNFGNISNSIETCMRHAEERLENADNR